MVKMGVRRSTCIHIFIMEKHVQPVPLKLKEDNIKTDELCGCDVGKTSSRPCVMDLGQIREI
jgi:hypothetical protein